MTTQKFHLITLFDTERQENFFEVHWGMTGEFQKTTISEVFAEINRICKRDKVDAVIEYSPNSSIEVARSECTIEEF